MYGGWSEERARTEGEEKLLMGCKINKNLINKKRILIIQFLWLRT